MVLGVSGCAELSFLQPPRRSQLDAVEFDAVVAPDGSVSVDLTATFADPSGGVLPIPVPSLGTTTEIEVDGAPVDRPATFDVIGVAATGTQVEASYVLRGLTNDNSGITVIELPVLHSPPDASRQDPPVAVTGTVHLPEGAALADEPVWANGLHTDIRDEGATVEIEGESPIWLSSELLVPIEEGVVASATPFATQPWQARRQQARRATAELERTLDDQDLQFELAQKGLVAFCVAMAAYVGVSFLWHTTREGRDRRRRLAAGPESVAEPPSSLDPAVVAVLVGLAKRLDQDAVAGTVLSLVERRVLHLDGYGQGRWVLRVPPGAEGETAAEQLVIGALRVLSPSGEIVGPPLWTEADPGWWRGYRKDVLTRARHLGLIERRFRFVVVGPFLAGIVGCTWPLWFEVDEVWIVPVLCIVGGLFFAVPLGGGFTLTDRGFDELMGWLGLGRYVRDHGELRELDPSAIAVWGPYLAYSAVLGEAPAAAAALAPTGGRERGSRREVRETTAG
jgi:hypothetical protein